MNEERRFAGMYIDGVQAGKLTAAERRKAHRLCVRGVTIGDIFDEDDSESVNPLKALRAKGIARARRNGHRPKRPSKGENRTKRLTPNWAHG